MDFNPGVCLKLNCRKKSCHLICIKTGTHKTSFEGAGRQSASRRTATHVVRLIPPEFAPYGQTEDIAVDKNIPNLLFIKHTRLAMSINYKKAVKYNSYGLTVETNSVKRRVSEV